ncbi:MAG TPA: hypothetical protein VGH79_10710 [Gaiellaceae bacterium]|jgi:hypothetical protein
MASSAPAAVAPLSRGRRIAVWTLVVLATVLALVAILTTWVNRQMLDNTAWKKATTQVIQDPQVQSALADYTVNQLYENVNVAQELENEFPPALKPLAPTLAGALQGPATKAVTLLLQRPKVQATFIQASAIAHEKLVAVLEDKTCCGISTGNGTVTLNAHELLVSVAQQLGLPDSVISALPDTAGTITLMKSDQLAAAQTGVRAIHLLSVWLLLGVLALYGIAIYLARGVRRATLRNAGLGIALVGLITLVIRQLLGNYITDALASPGYSLATHRLYLIGTSILGQIGQAAILYGVVVALGAVFAGPTRPAVWLRQRLAPVLNEQQGIVWGAVGFVYVLLVLWGGTHALRVWWGILLLAAFIAVGVAALRRLTLSEFPPGAALATAGAPLQAASAGDLARLSELHDEGVLGDDERAPENKPLAPE